MKKLIILTFSVLAVLTAYTKETKQPLSQVELLQQVFGNLVDTTRTVMMAMMNTVLLRIVCYIM
jgi:hypothetical protein